jgi:hypothetical protein
MKRALPGGRYAAKENRDRLFSLEDTFDELDVEGFGQVFVEAAGERQEAIAFLAVARHRDE